MLSYHQTFRQIAVASMLLFSGWLASSTQVLAKPPGKGGGDPLPGVVYFTRSYHSYSMDADGNNKVPIPGVFGEPGYETYSNSRWFVDVQPVVDNQGIPQFYPVHLGVPGASADNSDPGLLTATSFSGDPFGATVPWPGEKLTVVVEIDGDGTFFWTIHDLEGLTNPPLPVTGVPITGADQPLSFTLQSTGLTATLTVKFTAVGGQVGDRWGITVDKLQQSEIVATRGDDLSTVTLTAEPDMQPLTPPQWSPGDASVSWVGQVWNSVIGDVDEVGIYELPIAFQGGVPSPAPLSIRVVSGVVEDRPSTYWHTTITRHDWKPDLTAIVYDDLDEFGVQSLYINDFSTDSLLTLDGREPRWSPDGSKIVFHSSDGIETIQPDGQQRDLILARRSRASGFTSYDSPQWASEGSGYIIYRVHVFNAQKFQSKFNVYRATSTGSGKTNLTADADEYDAPVVWRNE